VKIELLESCASDLAVVNAARVSFANQIDAMEERDHGLIRFLMRERHGTPFEHGYFRFHVEAPIFVFREWHRHRVGHSYNEMSARYVQMEPRFYVPERWRVQEGKPGAYIYVELDEDPRIEDADNWLDLAYEKSWQAYEELLALGVAKEQARAVLPVGIYSQMYWSCNPRSLMHFLSLRAKPNALKEIRDLAEASFDIFAEAMPTTAQAFLDSGMVAP
jgi:thymidylate synthase (FAD)